MVHRYVWWDEVKRVRKIRTEIMLPQPLREFSEAVAKEYGVSLNALLCGMVAYLCESQGNRRLHVEVIPAVRITERNSAQNPVLLTVPEASPAYRKRSRPTIRPIISDGVLTARNTPNKPASKHPQPKPENDQTQRSKGGTVDHG